MQTTTMSYITQFKSLILLGKAYSVDNKTSRGQFNGYDRKKYFQLTFLSVLLPLKFVIKCLTMLTIEGENVLWPMYISFFPLLFSSLC